MIVYYIPLADEADFNTTIFNVTFPSDEGHLPIADVPAPIMIVDDPIDEAEEQFFIVYMQIIEAVEPNMITVTRANSTCIIVDNDGK